jgi:hypothetical protein
MDREAVLSMLDQMAGMPSIELKMNIPADQRMALSGMQLDAMAGSCGRWCSSTPRT